MHGGKQSNDKLKKNSGGTMVATELAGAIKGNYALVYIYFTVNVKEIAKIVNAEEHGLPWIPMWQNDPRKMRLNDEGRLQSRSPSTLHHQILYS